jgi:ABC-2 type transport system ATP-binding protein
VSVRSDSQPAISVTGLTKQFGARTAFENVSLDVDCGEVFGFLGPNGAGKTTMVRTLGALIAPTSGSATVAGLPLTPENAVSIRERISVMPESPGLYLRLSVAENLECFAGLYGISDPGGRIGRALAAVGLTDRAEEPCGKQSKGLRQRVSLARALLNDAEVVFLDEPTSGLDPEAAREVYGIIEGLRERGRAVFLTTHRLAEAERLCDRVALLNTTLRATGTPDELRAQLHAAGLDVATRLPLTDPDQILLGVPGVAGWELTGPADYLLTVSDADAAAPAIVRALVAAGADVLSVTPRRPSLEDVYLTLIRDDNETGVS